MTPMCLRDQLRLSGSNALIDSHCQLHDQVQDLALQLCKLLQPQPAPSASAHGPKPTAASTPSTSATPIASPTTPALTPDPECERRRRVEAEEQAAQWRSLWENVYAVCQEYGLPPETSPDLVAAWLRTQFDDLAGLYAIGRAAGYWWATPTG